ncbi:hypothetical protein [uncultured Acidaminococcus sp.]|uniref:hypothetical protein n=1 Tax=uncultured Acidaminococcus sp. TaxID=352152 RepID=UPI0025851D35|nr:hypothetical protein [uncultured Acidaminococcus sp.]
MCGIGHAIAKKNLEKGLEQGLEQGLAKGLEKGRFEGRQEERESNIVAMLKEKIPMETISRITHYSLDQIQKLGKLHGLL